MLAQHKKDVKQNYNDALQNYVTQYFGRPLEKVNIFFDGVSIKINSGVKEAEISFQHQFSKQELRKVLSLYPGREVKAPKQRLILTVLALAAASYTGPAIGISRVAAPQMFVRPPPVRADSLRAVLLTESGPAVETIGVEVVIRGGDSGG